MAATHVTLTEIKAQCNVDFTTDDTLLGDLGMVAEDYTLNEIQGEAHHTISGTVTTAAGTKALVGVGSNFTDFLPGDIVLVSGEYSRIIDTITDDLNLAVTTNFTGTNTAVTYNVLTGLPRNPVDGSLPKQIKQAILILVSHLYDIRGPVIIGASIADVPLSYKDLIHPYKNYTVK